jgi:hypothetical protein
MLRDPREALMDLPTLCNLALQGIGTRTNVTQTELNNSSTNEAIQFNLAYAQVRDELARMAQWDCTTGMVNLTYITSLPGTPENQSTPANQLQWTSGLPLPPWTYEYAYPVDCLRALWIVPQFSTGIQSPPIYPTSTGYSTTQQGPPIRFNVAIDQFYGVTAASPVTGGSGYAVEDNITLAIGPVANPPIGAPAQLEVTSVSSSGAVIGVSVVPSIINGTTGGAYFTPQTTPQAQGSTTGAGTGATFNLTFGPRGNQRVVLTNQEYATLAYCRQITDPNGMDQLFQKALYNIVGAVMTMGLTGDKQLANSKIQLANSVIAEARAVDANESLTINDVTPDFIRIRGVIYSDYWTGSSGFDWGSSWQPY